MIQFESKTDFLHPAEIHGAYSECLEGATEWLTMVMPWYTPSPQIRDQIFGMFGRDVALTLVTRPLSDEKDPEHKAQLKELMGRQRMVRRQRLFGLGTAVEFPLIELLLVKDVHAKTIIQDRNCVVVSSSNLNLMSIGRNTEFGIRCRESGVVEKALQAVENLRSSDRCQSHANGKVRQCSCGEWLLGQGKHACAASGSKQVPATDTAASASPPPPAKTAPEKPRAPAEGAGSSKCPGCGKPKKPFYPLCYDCNAGKKAK